jgi:hypothetical protein
VLKQHLHERTGREVCGVAIARLAFAAFMSTAMIIGSADTHAAEAFANRVELPQLAQFPGRRKTVTVVLPPPISGATKLYTPTRPETTATFCLPRAL